MMQAADPSAERRPLLRMRGIGKSFSGVPVLEDVSFDLGPGEVHILAGENGAGKTTLIKILAGSTPITSGISPWGTVRSVSNPPWRRPATASPSSIRRCRWSTR